MQTSGFIKAVKDPAQLLLLENSSDLSSSSSEFEGEEEEGNGKIAQEQQQQQQQCHDQDGESPEKIVVFDERADNNIQMSKRIRKLTSKNNPDFDYKIRTRSLPAPHNNHHNNNDNNFGNSIEDQSNDYNCPICGINLGGKAALRYHRDNKVCERRAERHEVRKGRKRKSRSKNSNACQVQQVLTEAPMQTKPCKLCGRRFTSALGLRSHVRNRVCSKKKQAQDQIQENSTILPLPTMIPAVPPPAPPLSQQHHHPAPMFLPAPNHFYYPSQPHANQLLYYQIPTNSALQYYAPPPPLLPSSTSSVGGYHQYWRPPPPPQSQPRPMQQQQEKKREVSRTRKSSR